MKKIFLIASGTVSLVCIVPFVAALSSGMCTTEYMPVCAQPPMQDCPSGMQCIQVMPQPETYGNACHMRLEGAKKIHDGACADRAVVIDEIYPGSDRDTYGCTGSAGYSWDSDLERCIRPWDTEAIFEWARKVGITTTQNPTEFKPESTITRDEAAAFLLRASEKQILPPQMITPMQYPFVDQEKIAPEFRSAVQFVHNTRIMQGDNNIFSPKNFLTHLEALIILTRAYEMGEGEVKIHPWYQLYLDAARMVGISVDESRIFLNQPISR